MADLQVIVNDNSWTLQQQDIVDEFDELQRTLDAELEGLEKIVKRQQETVNETSDNEVDNIELNNLSGLVERKPRMTSDSAINSDSPPPSPPEPLPDELIKMETASNDTGLPSSQPPSYPSSVRTPDLDYYPSRFSTTSPLLNSDQFNPEKYNPEKYHPDKYHSDMYKPDFHKPDMYQPDKYNTGDYNSVECKPSAFTKYSRKNGFGSQEPSEYEAAYLHAADEEIARLNYLSRDPRHELLPCDPRHVSRDLLPRDPRHVSRDLLSCDPRDRTHSDGVIMKQAASLPRNQLSSSQLTGLTSPPEYNALSPQPCPQSRGYASSMPFLTVENGGEKRPGRSHSPMSECSRTTNTSRISLAKRAIHNSHRHHSDEHSLQGSSLPEQLDLPHLMEILTTSTNGKVLNSAAGCIQHLAYNRDHMKNRIREIGCIPILVRLLQAEEEVCLSALGALRNLSFGIQNNLNKIAINEAHGVTLLVQLLKTSDNFEIQELVTGVFWNLSSSEQVKPELLKRALEPIVKYIIIHQSGWKGSQVRSDIAGNIQCTTVFRNATGCLRNLSSAGLDGRQIMRSCYGLVDSLLFVLRCVQGKNDVDNKAVENSVGILRNLSYRLDSEVSPEHKYGQTDDWRSKGLGGGQFKRKDPGDDLVKKKKNSKKHKGKEHATPLPEHTNGVGLLWQPNVVRVYLDLLLECSNPETLEGAAATLQNLTASSWEPAQLLREAVRKEKGLSVVTSLLRMANDSVVRSTAVCLKHLAGDAKNKELLGENAIHDLVKRLPGGEGADGITDMTIGAIISALLELVTLNPETARKLKELGGTSRLIEISRSTDVYSGQCVHISNRVLAVCWEIRELRKSIKHEGWNIAMLQPQVAPDRSDGLEYDESNNQFKASYNTGLDRNHKNRHLSPARHLSPRGTLSPGNISPAARRVLSPSGYEPNIHGRGEHSTLGRAATVGRSFDPNFGTSRREDYDMGRGQSLPARSLPPTRPLNSNYGVADSWV